MEKIEHLKKINRRKAFVNLMIIIQILFIPAVITFSKKQNLSVFVYEVVISLLLLNISLLFFYKKRILKNDRTTTTEYHIDGN